MTDALLIVVALLIDRFIGEPPNAWHPVVWMGTSIRHLSQAPLMHRWKPAAQLLWGAWIALLVPSVFACAGYLLLESLAPWPASVFVVSALLLKASLSLHGLQVAADTMTHALNRDLAEARFALRNLCSRDPNALSEQQLIAATIESVAENTSDSVIAPLFYFALFGVPGAVAYRAVNTMDAMIGYHGRWEYLGKAAARLDDALNWIPARLTALLLLLASTLHGARTRNGWTIAMRDAGNTESPNAGWPMATMAGLLDVQLSKEGHYALGDAQHTVTRDMIGNAWTLVRTASWLGATTFALLLGATHVIR